MLVEVLTPSESGPADVAKTLVPPPQTESDRVEFWSAADVGVSMTSADNFPNVVLEALAVGTPFIINDVGGAGEAVRETGGGSVVDEPTPEAFAHEIIRAAEAYSEWKAAGLSGARGVRDRYSPSRIGLLYASHYERALSL
jgi:glycosyltransferase involved in cell wall biosynthesis